MREKQAEDRVLQARQFATTQHRHQTRKVTKKPFIEHPIAVSEILKAQGARESVIIAGLLHDVLEDTPCTRSEIRERFGKEVLELVEACTDETYGFPTTKENWEERKAKAVEKANNIGLDALLIKVADKIANNHSLKEDLQRYGEKETWSHFNANKEQVGRHQKAMMKLFKKRLGKNHPLVKEAESVYGEIFTP